MTHLARIPQLFASQHCMEYGYDGWRCSTHFVAMRLGSQGWEGKS